MKKRISEILSENKGEYSEYNIVYSPHANCRPDELINVYDSFIGQCIDDIREDVKLEEMWAHDYELYTPEELEANRIFDFGSISVEDIYGPDDQILVIWLTHFSFEVLTNPDILPVEKIRRDLLGQYNDYLVAKKIEFHNDESDSEWEDNVTFDRDEGDEDYEEPREEFNVIDRPRPVLDV